MNSNFYNGKYTLIVPELTYEIDTPSNVDLYIGRRPTEYVTRDISKIYFEIMKKQLDEDFFYNGHIICNDLELLKNMNYDNFYEKNVNEKALFVRNVVHSGSSKYCKIDDSIMFCNGFVLPFVANVKRTKNSLYGSCHTNRIKIKELCLK